MRVLWFSVTPSLYDETKYGGWVASLEKIVRDYYPNIELGIAFEYGTNEKKASRENVTYYPIKVMDGITDGIRRRLQESFYWEKLRLIMINIIEDFKPDLIQCFGSEWLYGMIAKYTAIPVVIHMQGFLNIYDMCGEMAYTKLDDLLIGGVTPKAIYRFLFHENIKKHNRNCEKELMLRNSFFMGRTEWDKNIVRYFSHDSVYYYCPEAIREEIYNSGQRWKLLPKKKLTLVTITQGSVLKGNEIILRTAQILKEQFHVNFEWRIAGDINSIKRFERKVKIKFKDVSATLLGMIDPKEIVEELLNAHMYVHPAIIDNSPNSLCEAQLIGCPVIAANVGGISSLVDDGVTGVLYPYNEPYALAFRIMTMFENKNILTDLSQNEVKCSTERHEPRKIGETIINIYHDILDRSGNGE